MEQVLKSAGYGVSELAGINPTNVFASLLKGSSNYRIIEPISFTGWSTLLLVDKESNPVPRVAKGLFGYNSVLRTAPPELAAQLYGYYWYRQLPESAHEYAAQQFRQEARILELLAGAGAAPEIFEVHMDAVIPYYVMEYVPDGSVRQWRKKTQLGPNEAWEFARRLLTALDQLHSSGYLHRDLNAENVLVGPRGPVIADFGCALQIGGSEAPSAKSPILHWPPEYDQEYHRATPASDLYCFGMLMYELIAGTMPRYGAPRLSEQFGAEYGNLIELIEWCITWRPEERPAKVSECLDFIASAN